MGLRFSKKDNHHSPPPISFCAGQKVKLFGSDDWYEILAVNNPFNYTIKNNNDIKNISPSDISETGLLEIGTRVICNRFKEIENAKLTGVIIGAKSTNPPRYDIWLDRDQICNTVMVGNFHVESVTNHEIQAQDFTSSQ